MLKGRGMFVTQNCTLHACYFKIGEVSIEIFFGR